MSFDKWQTLESETKGCPCKAHSRSTAYRMHRLATNLVRCTGRRQVHTVGGMRGSLLGRLSGHSFGVNLVIFDSGTVVIFKNVAGCGRAVENDR